jgi:hypothetical protein
MQSFKNKYLGDLFIVYHVISNCGLVVSTIVVSTIRGMHNQLGGKGQDKVVGIETFRYVY